jgi:ribosomal protein S1
MSADIAETTTDEIAESPVVSPTSIADLKPKTRVKGTVKRVDLYGAIIDLGIDATALIHISKLGSEQVNRVSDVMNEGDTVEAWVEKVDPDRGQVMLTMVEPVAVDWNELKEGQTYTGKVTRLENFGAFVSIGAEREGLVHISELSHDYVKSPGEVVTVGDEVTVKVLGFNRRKRRIDLSMKALIERPGGGGGSSNSPSYNASDNTGDYEDIEEDYEELPTAMEIALRRALGNEGMESLKAEQRRGKKQRKNQSSNKRQMQQEVIDRILQMQSDN